MHLSKRFLLYSFLILNSILEVLSFTISSATPRANDQFSSFKTNDPECLLKTHFSLKGSANMGYLFHKKYNIALFAKIGVFFGSSTGNTEHVADLITQQIGPDAEGPYDIDTLRGSISSEFMKYDVLIVGTPTWNTGAEKERSGTGWDEVYYGEMQDLSIAGKSVAVFGLGDQSSYSENYADASGELHDVFKNLGCRMIGYTSQKGYEHDDSKAIRGNKFCCLLLDQVNQEDLTGNRIKTWVTQLKNEALHLDNPRGIDDSNLSRNSPINQKLETSEKETIFELQRENIKLKRHIEEQSRLFKTQSQDFSGKSHRKAYTPHLNRKTGRIMWTSPDGRFCYYTINTDKSTQ